MAAKLFALEEYPNAPKGSHPEELWGLITEASRIVWRKKGEKALESIGYFDIVKAAKDVVADATVFFDCDEDSQVCTHYIEELRDALQRGVILARP